MDSSPVTDRSIFVAGHNGMVGSAILRQLKSRGYARILTRARAELDLRNQQAVSDFFEETKPDQVIVAAAKVGGIFANNSYPADFLYDNLQIATHLIHAAQQTDVSRLLFLGSSCIYPKAAPQPISEEALLSGPFEETNEAYAIAKIAGIKLCQFYRKQHGRLFHSAMPCNLYGPGDNYHAENSHVIPGLIRRLHEAKVDGKSEVAIWGTGTPRREFLFVDDLASACLKLMEIENPPDIVNVGFGTDIPILELAGLIAKTVGFEGDVITDPTKPDGVASKLMDSSAIKSLGWDPLTTLEKGLEIAYADFLKQTT